MGLDLSSAKVSLNHLTHNNNKTQRYMQRMKTPEYKTTVGGFKKEKETYLAQMSGRGAQHSDCVHTLRTPLELEFTSAEASRLTPCDWQTESAQSSCRAEELATLNLKFYHNETEIGRPIRWLRRCIKRRRKNFSGDFLAFFLKKDWEPWLQNIHQKELFCDSGWKRPVSCFTGTYHFCIEVFGKNPFLKGFLPPAFCHVEGPTPHQIEQEANARCLTHRGSFWITDHVILLLCARLWCSFFQMFIFNCENGYNVGCWVLF